MLEMSWKFVSRQTERWIYDSVEKFGGLHWKKLKLGRDTPPHVDGSLKKILKHQTKVDNNAWWMVPVSFLYDNFY